jgi:molybdopterin-guanine dinucleotide biosynthesis protein A
MNFYILAGGGSQRMGQNKALLRFGGHTIIETIVRAIPASREQIKIVANSPDEYTFLQLAVVQDIYPRLGPISGIHAGLRDSSHLFNFFLGCDLPLISQEVILTVVENHAAQDILGVETQTGLEPLCTVYSKRCLPIIEEMIKKREYSLQRLFELVPSQFIQIPDPAPLFNLNTRDDWNKLIKTEREVKTL